MYDRPIVRREAMTKNGWLVALALLAVAQVAIAQKKRGPTGNSEVAR